MSLISKKNKVFGEIASARTLVDSAKKFNLKSNLETFTKGGNVIAFLMDLIISLTGYKNLLDEVVDILTYEMQNIESEAKKNIKEILKGILNCGINPSIPSFLYPSGTGLIFEIKEIDFFDLFRVDPNSTEGQLIYSDVTSPLTNSSDFNTFMCGVIQGDGTTYVWKNIFSITFNSLGDGTRPNNSITLKITQNYVNKKITDLNNDFINSLTLFDTTSVLNKILDSLYGSISIELNKTNKQLEVEAQINDIIDKISDSDDNVIDDSYFQFTNDEVYIQEMTADNRRNGILPLECCNQVPVTMPVSFLVSATTEIKSASTLIEKKTAVVNNLEAMANQNTVTAQNSSDKMSLKVNFIQDIIKTISKAIINSIISPKVVLIFLINFKIVSGVSATYNGPIDFIKKNKNLFVSLVKSVGQQIIKRLLELALKEITALATAKASKLLIEKATQRQKQLLSLVGVNQDNLKQISGS